MAIAFADYVRHDGLGLAALVRRGEIGASELLETALARIDEVNPRSTRVIRRRDEKVRAEAGRVDPAKRRSPGAVPRQPT